MDTTFILALFKRAVQEKQLLISLHAAKEALADHITRPEIEAAMLHAQVLEDYSDGWLGLACLIQGQSEAGRDIHIVASYSALPVTIIAVYEPRPPKWITPTQRGGRKR